MASSSLVHHLDDAVRHLVDVGRYSFQNSLREEPMIPVGTLCLIVMPKGGLPYGCVWIDTKNDVGKIVTVKGPPVIKILGISYTPVNDPIEEVATAALRPITPPPAKDETFTVDELETTS
jgi:hypothetical protein